MARRESGTAGPAKVAGAGAAEAVAKRGAGKNVATGKAAAGKAVLKKTAPRKAAPSKAAPSKAAPGKSGPAKAAGKGAAKAKKGASASAAPARSKPAAAPAPAAPASGFAREPRIDAYIAKAAPFAQPLLRDLRERVHAACPQAQETIKWGMPYFVYRGKILCAMAAFKQHASFGFWQGPNVVGAERAAGSDAMGQFGRLASLADLPGRREFTAMVKRAMTLIETAAARPPTKTAQAKPPPRPPADLAAALAADPAAAKTFDGFPPSQQREYVEWVESAKREDTRRARVAQAVEWMAQGKPRNWKYMAK